ncbi:rCG29466 [Rattus norvegicus]|uniref:RCG29466 n=1 Tax=Rattus norvegicus TaxID=10116 RepID=A6K955_RAT|nr:rCG29466 [Rattus norvegicus]
MEPSLPHADIHIPFQHPKLYVKIFNDSTNIKHVSPLQW